jgi:RHS repeat-associated protein
VSHNTSTGSTGTVTYFPFGAERSRTGFVDTDRTFTGQVSDGDTGLMFYNARYYDPVAGRFTQADTILADGPNRYSYVLNNPLNATDPTGRCSQTVLHADGGFTCILQITETLAAGVVHVTPDELPGYKPGPLERSRADICGSPAFCFANPVYPDFQLDPSFHPASSRQLPEPPEPFWPSWWPNASEVANSASAVGEGAFIVEVGSLPFAGLGPGAVVNRGAASVGTTASGVEFAAGLWAGEWDHVLWGGAGLITGNRSRIAGLAGRVDDASQELRELDRLITTLQDMVQQLTECVTSGCTVIPINSGAAG